MAPVEAALEDLQRRICRLVLEALLAELQVRLQVEMRVGGGDIQYTYGDLCKECQVWFFLPAPSLSPLP